MKIADLFVDVTTRSDLVKDVVAAVKKAQAAAPKLTVQLDTKHLDAQFDRVVDAIERRPVQVRTKLDTKLLELKKAQLQAMRPYFNFRAELNTEKLAQQVNKLQAEEPYLEINAKLNKKKLKLAIKKLEAEEPFLELNAKLKTDKLRLEVQKMEKEAPFVQLRTELDTEKLRYQVEKMAAEAPELKVRAGLATQKLRLEVAKLQAEKPLLELQTSLKAEKLRIELEKLQAEEPYIDIQAELKTEKLRLEVAKLQAEEPELKIRAELQTATAQAQLALLQARVAALGSATREAGNSSRALGGISAGTARASAGLGTLIAVLGPGLIPVVGAATAAVLGFGNALSVAGAGAFTAALSLSGIGKAVKAMGAVDLKGGREMAALANTQRSASAGVASARAALARATRSASDSIASALRNEENAARSLQRAQEDLGRAQKDLNDARVEAASDLEDYQRKLRGLAIDERKAVAEVEKARKRLELARGFGGIPQSIIDRLQLAYDDEVQSLDEVRAAQQDTREEIAKGVEGSDKVIAAKEAERNASEAVLDAQRGLADASRGVSSAQADAAASIADAQRGVADALAAGSFAADKQTASMNALDEAMRDLTPSQRKFAVFINSLRPQFEELRESAASSFLPKLEDAIRKLLPLMPKLNGVVKIVGDAMGDMLNTIADWVAGGAGQRFLDLIGRIAPPMFEAMGRAAVALGDGLLSMLEKTEGLSVGIANGIADMAEAFRDWVNSESFDKFLEWATDSLRFVKDNIGGIADGIIALVQAAEPWGRMVLNVMETLGKALAAIPEPVLAFFVTMFLGLVTTVGTLNKLASGFNTIMNAWRIAKWIADIGKLSAVLSTVVGSLKVASGVNLATDLVGATPGGKKGAKGAKSGAASALQTAGAVAAGTAAEQGAVKAVAAFGLRGVAIASAAAAMLAGLGALFWSLDQRGHQARVMIDKVAVSMKDTGKVTQDTVKIIEEKFSGSLKENLSIIGISSKELIETFRGGDSAVTDLVQKIYGMQLPLAMRKDIIDDVIRNYDSWGRELDKVDEKMAELDFMGNKLGDEAYYLELAATATDELADANQRLADALKDAWENLELFNSEFAGGRSIESRYEESIDSLSQTIAESGQGARDSAGQFLLTEESGRRLEDQVTNIADAYAAKKEEEYRAVEATQGHEAAMKYLEEQTAIGTDGFSIYTRGLYDTYLQAGLNTESAGTYARQLSLTPEQIKSQFLTPGITQARDDVKRLQNYISDVSWELEKLRLMSEEGKSVQEADAIVRRRKPTAYSTNEEAVKPGREGVPNYLPGRGGFWPQKFEQGGNAFENQIGTQAVQNYGRNSMKDIATQAAKKISDATKNKIDRAIQDQVALAGPYADLNYDTTGPGGWVLPKGSYRITQSYAQHGYAVDLGARTGTPVYAPFKGFVSAKTLRNKDGSYRSYGNYVTLSAGSKQFLGAHLSKFGKTGLVDAGEIIGYVGNTGRSFGPHLHAEIRLNGRTVNPAQWIKYDTGGILPHGGGAVNLSRRPEAILTFDQWKTLEKVASNTQQAGRGGPAVHIEHYHVSDRVDVDAFMQQVEFFVNSGRV